MKKCGSFVLLVALTIIACAPVISYADTQKTSGDVSKGRLNVNWGNDGVASFALTPGAHTLSLPDNKKSGRYTLILTQNKKGGGTITWPSSVMWSDGTAPTLTSTPNGIDVVEFVYDSGHYYGFIYKNFSTPVTAPGPVIPPPPVTPPVVPPTTVIFKDDFNRPDSDSTGNGWIDTQVGGGSSWGIADGRQFSTSNGNGTPWIYRTDIQQTSNISIKGKFSFSNVGSTGIKSGILAAGGYDNPGYYMLLNVANSDVSICDESGCKATSPFVFTNTADVYAYEWVITASPQNWSYLYVWNETTGAKPSSPTVSWTNGGNNFTPVTSGNRHYSLNGSVGTLYQYLYEVDSL